MNWNPKGLMTSVVVALGALCLYGLGVRSGQEQAALWQASYCTATNRIEELCNENWDLGWKAGAARQLKSDKLVAAQQVDEVVNLANQSIAQGNQTIEQLNSRLASTRAALNFFSKQAANETWRTLEALRTATPAVSGISELEASHISQTLENIDWHLRDVAHSVRDAESDREIHETTSGH